MARITQLAVLLATLGGCSLQGKPPPVPKDYPQLGTYEDGKAELVIDGEHWVSEFSLGATYNPEGGYDDELRLSVDLDAVELELRDLGKGEFTVVSGDLEASYDGASADADCGSGRVDVVGLRSWDSGLLGEQQVMWGTMQLEVCDSSGPGTHEISGRFSAVVYEI